MTLRGYGVGMGSNVTWRSTRGYSFFTAAAAFLDGDKEIFEGERCERGVPLREGVGNWLPENRWRELALRGGEVRL